MANGSNDLATSLVAAFADQASDLARNPIYLAIGELIGAAIFINMVVASVITTRSDSSELIKVCNEAVI